jgi:hydroxyacylglutathione hydrolase
MFHFQQMEIGPMANFIYLLGDPSTKTAAVVDPAWDVRRIVKAAEKDGFRITRILLTHGHPDHANGVDELASATGAEVYAHPAESFWLAAVKTKILPYEGGTITIGDLPVSVLHTPGHTAGSVCLTAEKYFLTGDTLFIGACGRTDLPGGSAKELFESFQKIRALDDSLLLCPGHHYGAAQTATLGKQKQENSFLATQGLNDFLKLVSPDII